MKIFVILPRVPYPLEKGDKLRAFNQIKSLSFTNEIHLCALYDKKIHTKAFESLKPFCKSITFLNLPLHIRLFNLFLAFFNGKPFQVAYFFNHKNYNTIQNLIAQIKPDRIYCQLIRVAEYVKNQPIAKTIDYQDVFSVGLERRIKTASVFIKPLIALEYLVKKILPLVKLKYPDIKLLISGTNPAKKVLMLKSENVIVSGWVNDMRDSYAMAKIFIAPMQIGTGLQNKLLEAMCMMLPCITSNLANCALGAENGKEILTANSPDEYASHILLLLNDNEKAKSLAKSGNSFVKLNYNWEKINDKLNKVICE